MRSQITELQTWADSVNQLPVNVSVAQDTQISQITTNYAVILGGVGLRR